MNRIFKSNSSKIIVSFQINVSKNTLHFQFETKKGLIKEIVNNVTPPIPKLVVLASVVHMFVGVCVTSDVSQPHLITLI